MTNVEKLILTLKQTVRDNYYYMRRRIDKGNGKKTLGWIVKRDDTDKTIENVDFYKLDAMKEDLKK